VRLILEDGKSIPSVARDLDLTESALRNWVEHARADRTHGSAIGGEGPGLVEDHRVHAGAGFQALETPHQDATPRERAYLETMERDFAETVAGDHTARLKALDEAWGELAERYPEDTDAVAFSALYHLAPARFLAKDRSHRIQIEAVPTISRCSPIAP
jgi:transposase-like protein